MEIVELNESQLEYIEDCLNSFDSIHMPRKLHGQIRIGIEEGHKLIAGLDACITAFRILYVSTVFVDEQYRRKGYGQHLIREMEKRAKEIGVNTIRLDTFSWQGKEFYEALGYKIAGNYKNEADGYAEYFFIKYI